VTLVDSRCLTAGVILVTFAGSHRDRLPRQRRSHVASDAPYDHDDPDDDSPSGDGAPAYVLRSM